MLRWRILLGALLIAALVGLLWLDAVTIPPGTWLFFLALAVGLAAAHEVATLLAAAGYRPLRGVIYGGTVLVISSNAIPLFFWRVPDDWPLARLGWPLLAFAATVLAALVGEMRRYRRPGTVMVNLALATLAVTYVGVLLSFALQLRVLGGRESGMTAFVALVVVVKLGDIGAYSVGRLVGRHKMAPSISPGKTIEGAAGAVAFGCLGAWLSLVWLPLWSGSSAPQPMRVWLAFGLIVGGAGILGDLAESLFKRDLGSKDSSSWLPGFGGVLDLLDSILFAAPVAYLCWLIWVV
ncbi:MAG TPA: phosphatidate cytidylyltransferase [Pirellulales bacterium]|nr:phosphatidate cytidylyltransferase [Pirellulales bacterium]